MSQIDPPSNLLACALEAEKRRPDPPGSLRDHVLVRVVATAALATVSAGVAAESAQAVGAAMGKAAGPALEGGTLSAKIASLVVAAFVGGGVTGATLHAAITKHASAVVSTSSTAPSASRVSLVGLVSNSSAAPPTRALDARADAGASLLEPDAAPPKPPSAATWVSARAPFPRAATSGADTDLSTERAVIERARTALMRGDSASALTTLEMHARDFPRGRLAPEREVLTIQALVGVGRRAEADSRANRFRTDHPDSPMLAAINAVLPPPPSPKASSSQ